jgi:hypothetical protein
MTQSGPGFRSMTPGVVLPEELADERPGERAVAALYPGSREMPGKKPIRPRDASEAGRVTKGVLTEYR